MAITYPLTLPSVFLPSEVSFDIDWQSTSQFTRGGGRQMAQIADPFWRLSVQTARLQRFEMEELRAWVDLLRGGQKTFLAHDPSRPLPRNYPSGVSALTRAGGGAFDGTATVTAITNGRSLTFGSGGALRLPASFVFKAADYLSLVKTGTTTIYSLHRVMEAQTADATGVVTLSVEPPVKSTIYAAPVTANLVQPLAEFVIEPGSFQGVTAWDARPASFQARAKVS